MKKVLVLCLAAALLVTVVITGSVAYFTDTVTTAKNVLAAGNLDIVQYEWERTAKGENDVYGSKVFTQEQNFLPGVSSTASSTEEVSLSVLLDGKTEVTTLPVFTMNHQNIENYIDKIVCAENRGSLPVYVRCYVAVPTYYGANDQRIAWIHPDFNTADGWTIKTQAGTADNIIRNQVIDGVTYDIYVATLTHPLSSKDVPVPTGVDDVNYSTISAPSLMGFYMDSKVSNEGGHYIYLDGASKTPLWEVGKSDLSILVCTAASQSRVFDNVWEAMEATYYPSTGAVTEAEMITAKFTEMVTPPTTNP